MKQLLQSLKTGETTLAEVPCPHAPRGGVLVRSLASAVSPGTERMLIGFGKANLLAKARQQPEKVARVLEKVKTDGLTATLTAVQAKLEQPIALGYSNAGVVVEVGADITDLRPGDRVASNGPHAEYVAVPRNLCAVIPDGVSDGEAAFTVIGAIALQAVRLAAPTLGETIAVSGLGMVGLLCVQLLLANGCRVVGLDWNQRRCELARSFGAEAVDLTAGEDPVSAAGQITRGAGVDAVIIAAATPSSDPVHQAAEMCRKRGRIVMVGVTGLELRREDFYEKELTFQVSCSYGPGRYDSAYEEKGVDYPIGFVRWTEQRNLAAFLGMLATKRVRVEPLVTHRYAFDEALSAYTDVLGGKALGVLLEYEPTPEPAAASRIIATPSLRAARQGVPAVGLIGAGGFARGVLGPAMAESGARLRTIVSRGGADAAVLGRKLGFEVCATEMSAVLGDAAIEAVFIATRHDSHAELVLRALAAGKHVFVEKPLCLHTEELEAVKQAYSQAPGQLLMVGFNRRFSPLTAKMKSLLDTVREPKHLVLTVNAGAVPPGHWVQDAAVGGGRLLGEGCHFIDLARFLIGAPIADVDAVRVTAAAETGTILLRFAEGSVAAIHYLSNGSARFPKERIEAFAAGRVLQLDNFRKLAGYGWPRFRQMRLARQDKGHRAEVRAFLGAISSGSPSPIPFEEVAEVTAATLSVGEAAR